ncbi:hypothetical protein PT282_05275 [Bifidobacterium sp. ESL0763]|uniref:hypothetical protein n=1 Tax=Bifidobacterium sp. ESL0763 TaxID=2983227 RepID=UPI0023F711A1|nr:hypothetical protein [Bifidobacterium sp. ESL0763]MDF7664072.1 hypothetical protein [Bifidobacterium sp. ESL0763]
MTSPKDTNDADEPDEVWQRFASEHADDLDEVSRSRQARRFERHAKRQEKERLLSVDELDDDAFAGGGPSAGHGPRDFQGSSWLDTDAVMDEGSDFTPPNPRLGHLDAVKVVFWALLVVGVLGIIATALVPRMAGMLATVFGLCALVGAAGLIIQHRGHSQTRSDYFDDGSRV